MNLIDKLKKKAIRWAMGYDERKFWILKDKCRKSRFPIIKAFYLRRYNREAMKFGAYVGYNAHFQDIPTLPHGLYGVFISDLATIGKNCVIFHHVTIGANTLKDSNKIGGPTIGDNCYIGAGAKIIGNIKIGNNVRIGANCVVVKDIPDNCTVVLPHPRIIQKEIPMDNSFIRSKREN